MKENSVENISKVDELQKLIDEQKKAMPKESKPCRDCGRDTRRVCGICARCVRGGS